MLGLCACCLRDCTYKCVCVCVLVGGCCAATPKERQRHSKKCKELVSAISQRVEQYNLLVQEYNRCLPSTASGASGRTTTTQEAVRQQDFCWVNEYSRKQAKCPVSASCCRGCVSSLLQELLTVL